MSLKAKAAAVIIGCLLVLCAVNFSVQRFIILPGFLALENEEALKNLQRVEETVKREIYHLDSLLHDWSSWNDTCEFIESQNDEYISANLLEPTFKQNKINLIYYVSNTGDVVWKGIHGLLLEKKELLYDFMGDFLPNDHPLMSSNTRDTALSDAGTSGLYSSPGGILAISSRPILRSDGSGPSRGRLIFGYLIDDSFFEEISLQTRIDIEMVTPQSNTVSLNMELLRELSVSEKNFVIDKESSSSILEVYTILPDIRGEGALTLKLNIPRKIFQKAFSTIIYSAAFILITMVVVFLVMILLIHCIVVKPVEKLKHYVMAADKNNPVSEPHLTVRKDEIGVLEREFVQLIELLQEKSLLMEGLNRELANDIKRRIEVESALKESEERLRTVLENLPVGVIIHDFEKRFLMVNRVLCLDTGYEREDFLSMSVKDLDPREFSKEERKQIIKDMEEKGVFGFESVHKRKDGTTYPVEVYLTRITLDGKWVVLSIALNISDRRKAEEAVRLSEEKLTRAKKMESLGLMAGGVAHDLNNVLSGIVSYPEMLLMDLPEESRLRKPIETMQKSGNRAVAIIQDLLTVARGIALEKDPLNLNRVVDKYLESERHTGLLRNNPDIALKTETDNSLLNIKGSSVHIEKALFNLVSNAIDALDDKGTVTIKTENRYLDKSLRGYEEIKPGEYAVLSVADDGEGISSKDLERIFEPFYSKKVMGRSGTGLGLPVVWNMIHEHDGYVDVRSGDNGTIFELYFPITREKILKSEEPVSLEDYRGNGEKILVVDDDESQRDILCAMMKKLGYLPTAMPGGEEAVEYLKTRSADLVILDMVMDPGINGKETYEQIVKIRPGQKAIIVSGFAEIDDVREAQNLGVGRFIKKPAQMEKLGLAVREELDK